MGTIRYGITVEDEKTITVYRRRRLADVEQVVRAAKVDLDRVTRIYEAEEDDGRAVTARVIYERADLAAVTAAERAYDEAAESERVMQRAIRFTFETLQIKTTELSTLLTRREEYMISGAGLGDQELDAFRRASVSVGMIMGAIGELSTATLILSGLGHDLDKAERQRRRADRELRAAREAAGWTEGE